MGRLRLAGTDPGTLGARDWLDVAYVAMLDAAAHHDLLAALDAQLAKPALPDRERWGTDPAAQAGQRAMMALAGGPAPMRPKPQPGGDQPA